MIQFSNELGGEMAQLLDFWHSVSPTKKKLDFFFSTEATYVGTQEVIPVELTWNKPP